MGETVLALVDTACLPSEGRFPVCGDVRESNLRMTVRHDRQGGLGSD